MPRFITAEKAGESVSQWSGKRGRGRKKGERERDTHTEVEREEE